MLARVSKMSNNQDPGKRKSDEDGPKQSSLLICSEKAVYVYSLNHVAQVITALFIHPLVLHRKSSTLYDHSLFLFLPCQGIKKVLYKKKFQSSSCCWASTFCGASDAGLALLLSTGKIEIRWFYWIFFVPIIYTPFLYSPVINVLLVRKLRF
jgi:hypothetical protein